MTQSLPFYKKQKSLQAVVLFLRMFSIFLVLPTGARATKIFFLKFNARIVSASSWLFFGCLGQEKNSYYSVNFIFNWQPSCQLCNEHLLGYCRSFYSRMGAMASVIFALLADKTRNEVRARASAFLGMSIGIAFCLAFVLAPILSIWWNIHHFFKLISFLSFISLGVVILFVQDTKTQPKKNIVFGSSLQSCLKNKQLKIIYFGSFFSGMGLSSILFTSQIFYLIISVFLKKSYGKFIFLC